MKRINNLFGKIISYENVKQAIDDVNKTHRWYHFPDKPNRTVLKVEQNKEYYIAELQKIIAEGYEPNKTTIRRRYDKNAKKWRDIAEPRLYPDQYVHHALIQVIKPIMLRGMDKHVCGSIEGRGIHYGKRFIEKWIRNDIKGTKWCLQLDIKQFYPSIKPEYVLNRFKQLIKDYKTLDLIERTLREGVLIGAFYSQWYANTLLQPLDRLIRECGATHYIRYADNITVFSSNKKTLRKTLRVVAGWLKEHELTIKEDWQIYQCRYRLPSALGYRYGRKYTLLRKNTYLTFKRELSKFYKRHNTPPTRAQGLLSRFGMLNHCNNAYIYKTYVKGGTKKRLKKIVSEYSRELTEQWKMLMKGANNESHLWNS